MLAVETKSKTHVLSYPELEEICVIDDRSHGDRYTTISSSGYVVCDNSDYTAVYDTQGNCVLRSQSASMGACVVDDRAMILVRQSDTELELATRNLITSDVTEIIIPISSEHYNVDFSSTGELMACTTSKGISVYRTADGSVVNTFDTFAEDGIVSMFFSPDDKFIFIWFDNLRIASIQIETGETIVRYYECSSLDLSPDGSAILMTNLSFPGSYEIIDSRTFKSLATGTLDNNAYRGVRPVFDPMGDCIVYSTDSTIVISPTSGTNGIIRSKQLSEEICSIIVQRPPCSILM